MRLIDAEALKNKLQQHHDFFVNAWGGFREMPIQDKARCDELSSSIAEIFNAPTIDIVRCKECIHNPWDFNRADYTCVWDDDFADRPQTPDDFCSYGVKKGADDE